jgi:competence protein ComEC
MIYKNLKPKTQFASYVLPAVMAFSALVGTFIYFTLPFEVSVTLFLILSTVCLCVTYFLRRFYLLFLGGFFCSTLLVFLTHTAYQIQNKETVFLDQKYEQSRHWVVGQIAKSSSYEGRDKVTLENLKIYGIPKKETPKKVRVSASQGRLSEFFVGDWIALEAKLYAPDSPEFINMFDVRRHYWMNELGATGYVMGSIYRTSWPQGFTNRGYRLQKIRAQLAGGILGDNERDVTTVSDEKAVLTALVTGKRTYLTEEIYTAYRSSGLAHLLAISGLHIGLVAGFVFFGVRKFLACFPSIALRYNLKIPASILAILVSLIYTLLAGSTLPTLRAFLMVTFIFFALMLGRLHNALRILMLTLTLVLLLWPESLLTASFQMSFAAVFGLTLFNELREKELYSKLKIVQGMTYTKGVFLTSIVAGVATMPVAAWHFGEIHFVGFLVNILAIPLTAFVVMPFAFLGVLLMPLSLHEPFLWISEQGVSLLNKIALEGALQPFGHFSIDQTEVVYLLVFCLLMILCLYIQKFQKTAFVCLFGVVSLLAYISPNSADIVWLRSGQTILFGEEHHGYFKVVSDDSLDEKRILGKFKMIDKLSETAFLCDDVGCTMQKHGKSVLVIYENASVTSEDCQMAHLIFTSENYLNCENVFKAPQNVLATQVYIGQNELKYRHYKQPKGRVWH